MNEININVTQPFLPPLEEYQKYIAEIWDRNWLTNDGPLLRRLESSLREYLGIEHLAMLGNGTIALQIAIKALNLKGKIITTPFSYVATTSSIVWENCTPVFVDIDSLTWNLNPDKIEEKIDDETKAILATHVFGNPCAVKEIEKIAKKHNLKVIYDAAHSFNVRIDGQSIFNYGDISTSSFHATKIFHTIEGGIVTTKDENTFNKVLKLRNFGHDGFYKFKGIGINGKNSEFHAAMGLCNLKHIEEILKVRKRQYLFYLDLLKNQDLQFQSIYPNCDYNYSYFPIVFNSSKHMVNSMKALDENRIFARRYFYPLLSELDYVQSEEMKVAKRISEHVICLPLYHTLKEEEQQLIASLIIKAK